jgi:hypothetical protein
VPDDQTETDLDDDYPIDSGDEYWEGCLDVACNSK